MKMHQVVSFLLDTNVVSEGLSPVMSVGSVWPERSRRLRRDISPGAQRQTASSVQDGYGGGSDHLTWHRLELQRRDCRNDRH